VIDAGKPADDRDPLGRLRLRPLIPAILLVAIALNQIRLVYEHELDPWKGGGFGMFSTASAGHSRHTHLFIVSQGEEFEVDLPDELSETELRARSLPNPGWLDRLARDLAAESASDHPDLSSVRIELWRTRLDSSDLAVDIEQMRNHRYEVGGDGGS